MRTFVLAVCLSYFALSLRADPLRDRMDAYVRRYADGDFFSGVVRVTKGDRIIYENAFGYADRAWQVPNSLQTRFQIASLSKPMTATAILVLGEERKLSLEDKLSKFLPDFPNGDKITIEELLTHYSGLGDASSTADYNDWSAFSRRRLRSWRSWLNCRRDPNLELATATAIRITTCSRSSSRKHRELRSAIFSIRTFSNLWE